eukprot:1187318-Prorocentrum_minimum.AAC.1
MPPILFIGVLEAIILDFGPAHMMTVIDVLKVQATITSKTAPRRLGHAKGDVVFHVDALAGSGSL